MSPAKSGGKGCPSAIDALLVPTKGRKVGRGSALAAIVSSSTVQGKNNGISINFRQLTLQAIQRRMQIVHRSQEPNRIGL